MQPEPLGQPDEPLEATGLQATEQRLIGPVPPNWKMQCGRLLGSAVPPTLTGDCVQSPSLPQNCSQMPSVRLPWKRHCVPRVQLSMGLTLQSCATCCGPAGWHCGVEGLKMHFCPVLQGCCVTTSHCTPERSAPAR